MRPMQLVVSEAASDFVQVRGGRLYVWMKRSRCCGGVISLGAATDPPPGRKFRRVVSTTGIELFVPEGLRRLPEELHVDLQRRPRRVEAYWNGCAYVV